MTTYRAHGADGFGQIDGEYAFVLWDPQRRKLFVGCDALGLRGLAYRHSGKAFVASSRAVALLRIGDEVQRWDRTYLAHGLSGVWDRDASATAFLGISRLLGGRVLEVSARGIRHASADGLCFGRFEGHRSLTPEAVLREKLTKAVKQRLDAPRACIAWSGGIDSSAVAASLTRLASADAFTVISSHADPASGLAIKRLAARFPRLSVRAVDLSAAATAHESSPTADDPICSGPAYQVARLALWRAIREAGWRRFFDGEGGDEVFDIAWRPADLASPSAAIAVLRTLQWRALRPVVRDLVQRYGRGPVSRWWMSRRIAAMRRARPWLRHSFWSSQAWQEAWQETVAFRRRRCARKRLAEIVAVHGRYWRAQSLIRLSMGLEAISPLLDRSVVEFVGSLPARIAMDPRLGKAILRRMVEPSLGEAAWLPKREPLHAWLVGRVAKDPEALRMTLERLRATPTLREVIDIERVMQTASAIRADPATPPAAYSLAELFALVEWAAHIEGQYGVH
jgi:asparagine synthetase B (glutamine-hydrolysing)